MSVIALEEGRAMSLSSPVSSGQFLTGGRYEFLDGEVICEPYTYVSRDTCSTHCGRSQFADWAHTPRCESDSEAAYQHQLDLEDERWSQKGEWS